MARVKDVTGPSQAVAGRVATYRVTAFDVSNPPADEVSQVNWRVESNGELVTEFTAVGDVLDFDVPTSLIGRTIRVMPFRHSPTPVVSVVSQVVSEEGMSSTISPRTLTLHQKVPDVSEAEAVGPFSAAILRDSPEFAQLVKNENPNIVFKSEEANKNDDHMMTARLSEKVNILAELVQAEFPTLKLRITEAWDDSKTHAPTSRHLEGRAVDITASDRDTGKLGRLAGLAVEAGFDWVFFEDSSHVHASVKR